MDARKPLKILLIEDSSDDALLLAREIKKGGYDAQIKRIESAEELRKYLVTQHWDICITDHNMPSFNSSEVLEIINSSELDLPVVIVSGSIGEDIAVQAMKDGAHDYIMKENLTRLVPAIERELRDALGRKARREAEAAIRYMAYHDALTGLNNRNEFDIRLRQALQNAKHNKLQHTVLYLDLDQFKIINDTCGHVAGDELLKQLASKLKKQVREGDTLARLGGDEFGVLLENCEIKRAYFIANKILESVKSLVFQWKNRELAVGVSIGMVLIDENSGNVETIMSSADMACYAAKDQGRNRIKVYADNDLEISRRRGEMHWVNRIKSALESNRFELYSQMIMPLQNGSGRNHIYCEFLLRLYEGDKVYTPNEFMPAAERYDLMPLIDRWVIENALSFISNLDYDSEQDCVVHFINLSSATLNDDGIFDYLVSQLDKWKVDPKVLCFEVTETYAIANLTVTSRFMRRCRSLGIRFALDDFGSGFCSFSYLKAIPVDFLKVDGGFVRNMLNNEIDCSIVEAVNQIGHVAGLQTIAEYVESKEVMQKLKEMGLDFAQGYYIEKPAPLVELV